MNSIKNRIFLSIFVLTMFGCVVAPPSETVYVNNYKHRIVKVNRVVHGRTITVKVHHNGPLAKAERDDLTRWYKSKHSKPHHHVKVVFIRN
jgi:hypothetical protein